MRAAKAIGLATLILAVFLPELGAQTNAVTLTNYVTVEVTNVVTITNVVSAAAAVPVATNAVTEVKKSPWEGSVSAGLTLTRGNSHTLLYSGTVQVKRKTPENEFLLGGNGAYGSQNSEATVNNYGGYSQWNHLFTERFYSYIRVDAQRDVVADLDYRYNIGPGAGYYLVKATNTTLSVEAGAGMQYERLGGNYNSFGTLRFAENFEHKINDHARIWEKAEILPQLDRYQNYVVNFEVGIETTITKVLALKTYLDDTYQSQPAAGRYRNDVKIVTAASYKF